MKKIILLVIFACLLFGFLYFLNMRDNEHIVHYEKNNIDLENYVEDIFKINPYDFNISSLVHYNDSLYRSINERLMNNDLQLGFYIPDNNCQDCIIKVISKLKSLPDYIQDKIFIMTSFHRERNVRMWINSHKFKYPVYNSISFNTSEFGSKNRFTLFLINKTGIPSNFFMFEKIAPNISDKYFNHVISVFKKEEGGIVDNDAFSSNFSNGNPDIIVFSKHDFGELKLKERVTKIFEFENLSPIPFVITDVKANCGCTVTEWDKNPVNQGGKISVKVDFSADVIGIFSKRITVYSNAKGSPHSLTITGNVK